MVSSSAFILCALTGDLECYPLGQATCIAFTFLSFRKCIRRQQIVEKQVVSLLVRVENVKHERITVDWLVFPMNSKGDSVWIRHQSSQPSLPPLGNNPRYGV